MFIQPLCRSWVTIPGPRRAARCPAAKSRGSKPLEPLEVGPPYLAHGRVHSGRRGGPRRGPAVSTCARRPTTRPAVCPGPDGVDERPPPHVPAVRWPGARSSDRPLPRHPRPRHVPPDDRPADPVRVQTGSALGRSPTAGPGAEERQSEAPEARRVSFPIRKQGRAGGRKKLTPRNRNRDSQVCIRVRPQIERKLPYEFTQGLYGEESRQDFEGGAKWNFADRLLLSEVTCFGG